MSGMNIKDIKKRHFFVNFWEVLCGIDRNTHKHLENLLWHSCLVFFIFTGKLNG